MLVAVPVLVVPYVVVEVAVDDDGAELEDVLGAVGRPSRACNAESVLDDESAGSLDHAGGDRPALLECLVVAHVLAVVLQVGDGLVHVGQVEVAGAGVRAGLRGDGFQGGGDCFRAAVQDAEELAVGPLPGGGGVAGVQRGGGLAYVAADVDVVDQDRNLQAAGLRVVADRGDLLLVPVDEEDALADPLRVAAVGLVERLPDHRGDVAGDGGRYPFIARLRAGVRLAAGGRGGDVLRLADGGGEVRDGDDLGHFLDPGVRRAGAAALAVLRAQGDALAVGLHHDHVAVRLLLFFRVAGAFLVEVTGPGGEVPGQAGQLGAADRDPGPGLDDLLRLPVPAGGEVEGGQGAHPHGVGVIGQDLPGVGGIEVRLAPVTVGQPRDPHGAEDARRAPAVPGLDGAMPDPRGARDLRNPLLPRAVEGERCLQQPPLQLAALLADHLLPLPVVQEPRFARRPGQQPGELLRRAGQRCRQLPVHRGLAPVPPDRPDLSRQRHRPRRTPDAPQEWFRPSSLKRPRNPRTRQRRTVPDTPPANRRNDRRPAQITPGNARKARNTRTRRTSEHSTDITEKSYLFKRRTPRHVRDKIAGRLAEFGLELHPDKTKVVYCRDDDRRGDHDTTSFTFLSYTFRPRLAKNRYGKHFVSFLPAVSKDQVVRMQREIRTWRIPRRSDKSLQDLAHMFNRIVQGWINYYGFFYKSMLYPLLKHLNRKLTMWAMKKYKRLRRRERAATAWLRTIASRDPRLFAQWKFGVTP